jgi:hypothetical protein
MKDQYKKVKDAAFPVRFTSNTVCSNCGRPMSRHTFVCPFCRCERKVAANAEKKEKKDQGSAGTGKGAHAKGEGKAGKGKGAHAKDPKTKTVTL